MISQGISLFMRAQDIQSEDGLDLSSSAYREEILKDNPDIQKISNMFDTHIAPYMTYQENINILKLRLKNQKIIENVNNNITNDLLELAVEIYTNLYGDEDLYTKDSKKKYKNFDLRIVSKND
jgi:flagellin-like hook-associated protein FlgL